VPLWRDLLEALPDAVVVVDDEARIVFASQHLADLTGHDPEALEGRPVSDLVPAASRAAHEAAVAAYLARPTTRPMGAGRATTCQAVDGREIAVDIALSPLPMHGWIVAVVRDDRDRARTEAELFHRATHDPLTGLANRSLLEDRMAQALHRAARQRTEVAVLYVDLDRFKAVNDAGGHAAGDSVLQAAAAGLAAAFRPTDTVARLGGDEFVVLCEDRCRAALSVLAARAVGAVALAVQARAPRDAASVGLAVAEEDEEPASLLARADRAMYEAKRAGGARWSGDLR
jgi:diguanylate cyclase (GGDEF)-like protein/PAS domain S-box-containing protein